MANDANHSIPTVSSDQAKVILQFLQRTSLQGAETPAFADVVNILSAIAGNSLAENAADAKTNV